jgi:hypothetical protein
LTSARLPGITQSAKRISRNGKFSIAHSGGDGTATGIAHSVPRYKQYSMVKSRFQDLKIWPLAMEIANEPFDSPTKLRQKGFIALENNSAEQQCRCRTIPLLNERLTPCALRSAIPHALNPL